MTSLPESIKFTFTACSGVSEPSFTQMERCRIGTGPKVTEQIVAQVPDKIRAGYSQLGFEDRQHLRVSRAGLRLPLESQVHRTYKNKQNKNKTKG